MVEYVFYPRWRNRGRRIAHLVNDDGNTPPCRCHLSDRHWDVGTYRALPRMPICRRCRALEARQEAAHG